MKLLLFGEPLIRITPTQNKNLADQVTTKLCYGGSEINIARTLQGFKLNTKLLTALPNQYLGDNFIEFLNNNQIDTTSILRNEGRLGLYYLEEGYGIRQSEVYYDRLYTSIQNITIEDLDYNAIFKDITHFHFSGITIAISRQTRLILEQLLIEAKKRKIIISIDLNLRTKMISIKDAKKYFSKFASYADYCFGIDPIMLNVQDVDMFKRDIATIEDIKKRMEDLKYKYQFKGIFHTQRTTKNLIYNEYKAYSLINHFIESVTLTTPIIERVGSGDAFVAGAIYQLMNEAKEDEIVNFAVASGTIKCTIPGDSMFIDVNQIKKILNKNNEIVR